WPMPSTGPGDFAAATSAGARFELPRRRHGRMSIWKTVKAGGGAGRHRPCRLQGGKLLRPRVFRLFKPVARVL
ncbi:hypothetical protein O4J55_17010, partial [Paracoccus sp. PXZ]